jgi:hypothetical protein
MDIDKFKRYVEFVAKKKQSGSNPTPSEFNLAVERAYATFVMKRIGNPKEYLPGQPFPRIAWQMTQKISDDLIHLLVRREFIIPANGQLTIPDGTTSDVNNTTAPAYMALSSIRFEYITQEDGVLSSTERSVDVVRDNELGNRLNSKIIAPSEKSPICSFMNTYIQFYPKGYRRAIVTYLKQPTVPVWAYTLDSNGRPVYDATASVDLEAPDATHNEIAMETLKLLGISIREPELYGFAEQMEVKGV